MEFTTGYYRHGHVQGIAYDAEKGEMYLAFTTMLLKTDLEGREIGSVVGLAGHLGCITFDAERRKVYGSLEMKHDAIGRGVISQIGRDPTEEDAFYCVSFDCDAITRSEMNAETDKVMSAVFLKKVSEDYSGSENGKKHIYGCSGIDDTGLGLPFGKTEGGKKIMICYGIYLEPDRRDNDHQVILQYSPEMFETYGRPLLSSAPHHSGPDMPENVYFLHTGNTEYGVQNLEYDPYLGRWLVCVYRGNKPEYKNPPMFFIDAKKEPDFCTLPGREGEKGNLLFFASPATSLFPLGQTGVYSFGDGRYWFSEPLKNVQGNAAHLKTYLAASAPLLFEEE